MHDRIDSGAAERSKLEPGQDVGHLSSVLAIVAEAIISIDEAQNIIFFNRGAERIFRYAPSQVLGRPLNILLPERFREAHRCHVERFARSSITSRQMGERLEIRALRSDGEEFPAEASIAKTDADGGTVMTVVLRDVTEQRRTQEELASRERQLADAQRIASLGSWVWDLSTDQIHWSDEMYRIMGIEIGTPMDFSAVLEHVYPADRKLMDDQVQAALRTGDSFKFRHRVIRPGDEVRWHEARGRVELDEDGRAVRLTGTAQDITEFRRAAIRSQRLAAEQAAREAAQAAERRMAFLAGASAELASSLDYEITLVTVARLAVPEIADWVVVDLVDEDGTITRLAVEHQDPDKVALVQRLGERYSPDPEAPRGSPKVIRTGQTELVRKVTSEVLEEVAHDDEHLSLLRSLGVCSYVVAPLAVRGRVLGAMTFVQAESGRRYDQEDVLLVEDLARRAAVAIDHAQLVRELSAALKAKSDFMATMSHELRTPLNAIIGYSELLVDGVPAPIPEPAEAYVRRIGLSAQHLLQLINEILTFARLQAEREEVECSDVETAQVLDEIEAIIGPFAEGDSLEFRVVRDHAPDRIRTDARKLRQILLNLLGNAVKFTDEGSVELRVFCEDGDVVFQVSDTGLGIPPHEQRFLFEPFWQGNQSATRRSGGAGLGLPISDRFAKLLGGHITVESQEGGGSRFSLRLPMADSC